MRSRDVVDTSARLGPLVLANPIVAASGTFGHGAEFSRLCPLNELGAVTVKSLAPFEWQGNAPLRTTEAPGGAMLNSVGLAGPGVEAWIRDDLPQLHAYGATVIVSLWGRTIDDYVQGAKLLDEVRAQVAAIELNLSCPNLDGGRHMFAVDSGATSAVIKAVKDSTDVPLFAKLTAVVTDIVQIAGVALDAGATGLTLINTLLGLMIDPATRKPVLGAGGGGLSGTPIKPVALRAVAEVARAFPGTPIIGTGGVNTGIDAAEMLMAGASAVGVGTATFAEPRASLRIRDELVRWCRRNRIATTAELTGSLQMP